MPQGLRSFLALAQFMATSNLIFGNGFWQQFLVVFAIQVTAFFLTLNRRGLISANVVVGLYALLLIIFNVFIIKERYHTPDFSVPLWGSVAAVFRLGFRLNKYFVWTAILILAALLDRSYFLVGE